MSATISILVLAKGPAASFGLLRAVCARIVRYFVRRAAAANLRELDSDALKDIGLERSEIEAAVRGSTTARGHGRR